MLAVNKYHNLKEVTAEKSTLNDWESIPIEGEYAGESLTEIPIGFIDKTICGCGFTSVALENDLNTIVLVPNIELAKNKAGQYPNERCNHKILPVWGDTDISEINDYMLGDSVKKIICVYDSLHKVEHLLDKSWRLIVDESQELLFLSGNPGRRKAIADVFVIAEQHKDVVSFISATPTPFEYLPKWISSLPKKKFVWQSTTKITPIRIEHSNPVGVLKKEIIKPLIQGISVTYYNKTFNKAIIFINSLEQIKSIISEMMISETQCAIICGDSFKNDIYMKGIKRLDDPHKLPLLTFITASGFKGIDLYDSEAMTVVVSNTKKKWQMIDMLTDLKQAVSRQRKKDNPNNSHFIYIYNKSIFSMSEQELSKELDKKKEKVENSLKLRELAKMTGLLTGWDPSREVMEYTYQDGEELKVNEMAFNADRYFILELKKQYDKGFDINSRIPESLEINDEMIIPKEITYREMVAYFKKKHKNGEIEWGKYSHKTEWIATIQMYYKMSGKTDSNFTRTNMMIKNYNNPHKLISIRLTEKLRIGNKYTNTKVLEILNQVYGEMKVEQPAKMKDLKDFCTVVKERDSQSRYVIITGFL
jgi:hypothetical protein